MIGGKMRNHRKTNCIVYLYVIVFIIILCHPITVLANFFVIPVGSKSLDPSDIIQLQVLGDNQFYRVNPDGYRPTSSPYTVPLGKVLIITGISLSGNGGISLKQIRDLPDPATRGRTRLYLYGDTVRIEHYTYTPGIVIAPGQKLYVERSGTSDLEIFGYEVTSK